VSKAHWLDAAEVFDAWRIVPRLVLFGYCAWLVYVVDFILVWYTHLPASSRGIEASGMASVVITAVTGMGAFVFKVYVSGGRAWDSPQMTVTSTKTVTAA
jgi:hypothetical protein